MQWAHAPHRLAGFLLVEMVVHRVLSRKFNTLPLQQQEILLALEICRRGTITFPVVLQRQGACFLRSETLAEHRTTPLSTSQLPPQVTLLILAI